MRFFIFLVLLFFVGCSASQEGKTERNVSQLSCKEAKEQFLSLADQGDKSCKQDSDCVQLGVWGNCDCYIVVKPGTFSKTNTQLVALHERLFHQNACQNDIESGLMCSYDYTKGTDLIRPVCKQGQCTTIRNGEQNGCPQGQP